jgi:hypothetical protein
MTYSRRRDIYEIYEDFLTGKELDVGRRFHDVSLSTIVDRLRYLEQRCKGKKVLHLGCLDHSDIIPERIKNKTWLHSIISQVSDVCVGIDINSEAHELVRREFGIKNIQLLDLSKPLESSELSVFRNNEWDLILCPEMLEHLTNHQQLLENLRMFSGRDTTLIITVPNAFQFQNFINALRGFETINSDHKYWFTFYTLSRLLTANGWTPRQLVYYNGPKALNWLDLLGRVATRMSRVFCDGLIIEATCASDVRKSLVSFA